jgi:myo-inositol-1(or 4)-monophosphatase
MLSDVVFDNFESWKKEDNSYVTSLDIEIQEKVIDIILSAFKDHRILSEEGIQKYSNAYSDYTWVIDPIDGTNNFVKGRKEYGVSIGLMHKEKFVGGYVNFPAINESYFSLFDSGIFKNWKEWDGPGVTETPPEIILCSKSYSLLSDFFKSNGYRTASYSCAVYSMLRVLKGESLLYHNIHTNIYDVGPMSYILSQAGINSYNGSYTLLTYEPQLKKIPVFIAASNTRLLELFKNRR